MCVKTKMGMEFRRVLMGKMGKWHVLIPQWENCHGSTRVSKLSESRSPHIPQYPKSEKPVGSNTPQSGPKQVAPQEVSFERPMSKSTWTPPLFPTPPKRPYPDERASKSGLSHSQYDKFNISPGKSVMRPERTEPYPPSQPQWRPYHPQADSQRSQWLEEATSANPYTYKPLLPPLIPALAKTPLPWGARGTQPSTE